MKGYVKDHNGKYRLVDRNQETVVTINEQRPLTLEEIDARLRKVESILIGAQK